MKTLSILLLIAPLAAGAAQQPSVSTLGWLNGCWERTTRSGARGFEIWRAGQAGELLGSARVIRDTTDRETERLRIYKRGDTLVYHAYPSNQPEHVFPLRAFAGDSLVFEDPAHDFPQRIVYRRVGNDSLIAVVSNISGDPRAIRYPFKRGDCPPPRQ